MRPAIRSLVFTAGLLAPSLAGAATLTGSLAAWQAGVGAATVTTTASTGLSTDPFALVLPTTSVIPLADGQTLALSTPAQVTQPQNGYPYALSDGYSGDLLIPQDASGNQVTSETITPSGSLTAFGFEAVPFSNGFSGPFNLSVALAGGQTLTQIVAGANPIANPVFFGYYGGSVKSITISTSDPNGFAFGNFVDVPEPASVMLLMTGLLGVACLARRRG